MRAAGHTSVMASRAEAPDSLDFFPTPPWSTRALCEIVFPKLGFDLGGAIVWEPACGEGHMANVLDEYVGAGLVLRSDVHDYGIGAMSGSFVGEGLDVIEPGLLGSGRAPDWIITNPPFALAEDFLERALREARVGVALLVRSVWSEGRGRYERVFSKTPPIAVAQFAERVPMVKGRWDPEASSATAYAWFVWLRGSAVETRLIWIPPGQRQRLTRPDDVARFTGGVDVAA